MIEKTVKYYQIDELPQDVIDDAYESWREYWGRNADAYVGPTVDEDLKSLQFALESIQCKLVDWSVNYSGWGRNTCQVEMDSNLSWDMTTGSVTDDGVPTLSSADIPEAQSDGLWIAEGFMERWNSQCRPQICALVEQMHEECDREVLAPKIGDIAYQRGNEIYEKYLSLAQEQADLCMRETQDEIEAMWTKENFLSDSEGNGWYFEEDGTFAGHVR